MTGYEEESHQVQPFDLSFIQPGQSIVLVGTNTKLAEAIIKQLVAHLAPKVKHVRVYSCSGLLESIMTYIPGSYINDHYDEGDLGDLYDRQKENMSWCDDKADYNVPLSRTLKNAFNTLLIMDKCAVENKTRLRDNVCHEMLETHGLNHCTIIYRSVEMDYVPYGFNHHFDFCFVLSSSSASEHAKLFNRFGGLAQSLSTLRKALSYNITDTFAFVIMQTPVLHVRPEDEDKEWKKYFAKYNPYTTPVSPSFRFGNADVWRRPQRINHREKKTQASDGNPTALLPPSHIIRREKQQKNSKEHTLDEIIKVFGKNKKLRIEVLSEDEDDSNDPYQQAWL